jgi:hypothetical protein
MQQEWTAANNTKQHHKQDGFCQQEPLDPVRA